MPDIEQNKRNVIAYYERAFNDHEPEDAVDGAVGVRSMDGSEHDVPGFGGAHGGLERLAIAHFAHEDDVGVFAHRVLQRRVPVVYVEEHFALVHD